MNPVMINDTRVEIGHIKDLKTWEAYGFKTIKIDSSSPYGNTFVMANESERERARVCTAFSQWLNGTQGLKQKQLTARLLKEIREHKRVVLLCWCAPLQCHGKSWQEALLNLHCAQTACKQCAGFSLCNEI